MRAQKYDASLKVSHILTHFSDFLNHIAYLYRKSCRVSFLYVGQ